MKKQLIHFLRTHLMIDWDYSLKSQYNKYLPKSPEYHDWLADNMVAFTEDFVAENGLLNSQFVQKLNMLFATDRFNLLVKRWILDYLFHLLNVLDDVSHLKKSLILEDSLLNCFAVKVYEDHYKQSLGIIWRQPPCFFRRTGFLGIYILMTFVLGILRGIYGFTQKGPYKVMREGLWGLGRCHRDDFLVDGKTITAKDFLLFSRGIPTESGRLKAYNDMRNSPYDHINLSKISFSVPVFIKHFLPKYLYTMPLLLTKELFSGRFSLYWNIIMFYFANALPYERLFSKYKVSAEMGHGFFSARHIAESIVCQNNGCRYYLMNWSDNSIYINRFISAYLACDAYFLWGSAYVQGFEGVPELVYPVGYFYKKMILNIKNNRQQLLPEVGINSSGKIISFFDESFDNECNNMTEAHYVNFWKVLLELSEEHQTHIFMIKPKGFNEYLLMLSDSYHTELIEIRAKIDYMPNIKIIDPKITSFIEVIGVSDIVVTQGMTSSATIALICGINGLYLDEGKFKHPFAETFLNKLVFHEPKLLKDMIRNIINGTENPIADIPEELRRNYDAFDDDKGLERMIEMINQWQ